MRYIDTKMSPTEVLYIVSFVLTCLFIFLVCHVFFELDLLYISDSWSWTHPSHLCRTRETSAQTSRLDRAAEKENIFVDRALQSNSGSLGSSGVGGMMNGSTQYCMLWSILSRVLLSDRRWPFVFQVDVGRIKEISAALEELEKVRIGYEKEERLLCDMIFSRQAEEVSRACRDLSQKVKATSWSNSHHCRLSSNYALHPLTHSLRSRSHL